MIIVVYVYNVYYLKYFLCYSEIFKVQSWASYETDKRSGTLTPFQVCSARVGDSSLQPMHVEHYDIILTTEYIVIRNTGNCTALLGDSFTVLLMLS